MSANRNYCQARRKRELMEYVLPLVLLATVALGVPADVMVKVNEKHDASDTLLERALNPRTLVVLTADDAQQYSKFTGFLRTTGHRLTVSQFSEESTTFPELLRFGEAQFDNLLLITTEDQVVARRDHKGPDSKLVAEVTDRILQFVEKHSGNLMILGRNPVSDPKSSSISLASRLIQRLSATVENSTLPIQDFFENYEGNRSILKGVQAPTTESVFSPLQAQVAYEGVAHVLSDQNLLAFPLLYGSPTAFTANPRGGINSSGSSLALVFALQTRTNSRIVVSGSFSLCSDRMIQISPSNLQFCQEISEWNFQRRGVVDWSKIYHRKLDSVTASSMYRIYDDIEFQVDLHQLAQHSKWLPFNQSRAMQLEYVMLDPHWRLFLHNKKNKNVAVNAVTTKSSYVKGLIPITDSTYSVAFKAPDRYGIFKFVFRLTQKGLSFIHLETLAPSRNFKHDDYERFLWVAFPYYASTFAALALVVVFSSLFMRMSTKLKSS